MSRRQAAAFVDAPRPADAGYRVEVVSDHDALATLQPVWNTLVREADVTHPFLSHEWFCSWWESFGVGKQLHVLVVKNGAQVVGIAPLMRNIQRVYGLRVRRLGFIYNPHSPRLDFILAPPGDGVYRAVWQHLLDIGDAWDVLEFSQLPSDSTTLAALARIARAEGYRVGVWHGEDSPVVAFDGSWEGYVQRLSRNHRTKVRKGLKRLSRRGEVRLEVVSEPELLDAALDDGLRIEAAAWKSQTGTAILSQPPVERFYRSFAQRAASMNALRLMFLNVAGSRVAFAYGLSHRNKLYVLKAGYDPTYSYYSPYNLLCYLVFKDGFERGMDEYEFLGNNDPWKLDWTQQVRAHEWLFVFAPTARARLLYQFKFRLIPVLCRQRWLQSIRYWFRSVHRPVQRAADLRDDLPTDD